MTEWGRTRTESSSKGQDPWDTWTLIGTTQHGYPANPPPTSPQRYASLGSETKTTCDFIHPGYRKRIQAGEIINSPFLCTTVDETLAAPGGFAHIFRTNGGYTCAPPTHPTTQTHDKYWKTTGVWRRGVPSYKALDSGAMGALRQDVIDLAVTTAHANIDTSEMLALATAAESGKTVQSMQAVLFRALKIARNVRKLNLRAIANELSPKEVADRYMEARYAFRPLIIDAAGICAALEKNRGYARKTFRGSAEDSMTSSDTLLNQSNGLWMTQTDWSRTSTYDVSARAGVMCDVSISDISVFGLDQIAETAWELAPYSFIVDWFANVGDWIAAHTPNAGVNQRASWVTVKTTYTQTRTATADRSIVNTVGYIPVSLSLSAQTDKREELVLERITSPALSTFPSSNLKLDVFKITDLGIMLRKVLS